jgi:hypothetical protein
MRDEWVQFDRPMGLTTMQKDRDACNGDMSYRKRVENDRGPGPAGEPVLCKGEETIQKILPVRDNL